MYSVGARELQLHTVQIVDRVLKGERVLLTLEGEPVAMISPIDRHTLEEAVEKEAGMAERDVMGWLTATESAFSFWDNTDDEVWDEFMKHPSTRKREE